MQSNHFLPIIRIVWAHYLTIVSIAKKEHTDDHITVQIPKYSKWYRFEDCLKRYEAIYQIAIISYSSINNSSLDESIESKAEYVLIKDTQRLSLTSKWSPL